MKIEDVKITSIEEIEKQTEGETTTSYKMSAEKTTDDGKFKINISSPDNFLGYHAGDKITVEISNPQTTLPESEPE